MATACARSHSATMDAGGGPARPACTPSRHPTSDGASYSRPLSRPARATTEKRHIQTSTTTISGDEPRKCQHRSQILSHRAAPSNPMHTILSGVGAGTEGSGEASISSLFRWPHPLNSLATSHASARHFTDSRDPLSGKCEPRHSTQEHRIAIEDSGILDVSMWAGRAPLANQRTGRMTGWYSRKDAPLENPRSHFAAIQRRRC